MHCLLQISYACIEVPEHLAASLRQYLAASVSAKSIKQEHIQRNQYACESDDVFQCAHVIRPGKTFSNCSFS